MCPSTGLSKTTLRMLWHQYLQLALKPTSSQAKWADTWKQYCLSFNVLHIFSESSRLLLWKEYVGASVEGVPDEGFAGMCRLGVIGIPCSATNCVTGSDVVTTLLLHVRVVVAVSYPVWAVVCLLVALVTMCSCAQPSFPHIIHKFRSIKLPSSTSHTTLL